MSSLLGSRVQQLVQEAHGCYHPTDNGTNRREKGNVSLSIPLDNLDVQGRDLVKEKDSGKACWLRCIWYRERQTMDFVSERASERASEWESHLQHQHRTIRNYIDGSNSIKKDLPLPPPGLTCLKCSVTLY